MEHVFFNHNEGEGLIQIDDEPLATIPETVKVGTITIEPGFETDLQGFFSRKVKYVGLYETSNVKAMLFYIGETSDLFNSCKYYKIVYRIAEERLFVMYTPGSGRDYNFIKGKWK